MSREQIEAERMRMIRDSEEAAQRWIDELAKVGLVEPPGGYPRICIYRG